LGQGFRTILLAIAGLLVVMLLLLFVAAERVNQP
jgi:hypothetical protein